MKIAMISDARFPIIGGGQIHIENICEKLINNYGCEIDLFVRSLKYEGQNYTKDEYKYNGKLRILRCGRAKEFFDFSERIFSIFSMLNRIIKENKKQKYDIIHAHSNLGLLVGKIASFLIKKPIIATIHGSHLLDTGKGGIYYYIEKWLLTGIKYDLQISVGSGFLKYKNINKNIRVIPNGVNLDKFDSIKVEKNKNIFKILFVGRLQWTKGIDILIEAVNKIDRSILDERKIEFHIVGYGYQEEEYKSLVKKYSLEKYFKFRGKIVGDELIKEYKSSDLFILPSRSEGLPLVIIEAMAAKLPVIATICGGPEDIINDGENGFLVEKENVDKLRDKILYVLSIDLEGIRNAAYKTVLLKYSRDKIVSSLYKSYLDILYIKGK